MTSLWHPFASMAAVEGAELVISRGEGVFVWDDTGKQYLDATASLWYCQVGHGRVEIIEAMRNQANTLEAYHTFGDFANPRHWPSPNASHAFPPTPAARCF